MLYIGLTLLSWIVSGVLSIFFRTQELKKQIILMHKQLFTQIALFIIFLLIFKELFSDVFIDLWFIKLGWFSIYLIFSTVSFYAVQVFYEYFSWNKLFATEEEMKAYLEKLDNDRR